MKYKVLQAHLQGSFMTFGNLIVNAFLNAAITHYIKQFGNFSFNDHRQPDFRSILWVVTLLTENGRQLPMAIGRQLPNTESLNRVVWHFIPRSLNKAFVE